ncbi:MAG: hypothetical protein WD989_01425 [Candidatus Paceibacterota bacterium]
MALGVNELKQKTFFIYEDQPYVVLETHHLKMQQRRPTVQVKMRNLINGKLLERNFAQSDVFEPADVERRKVKFLYNHRDQYWFSFENNPTEFLDRLQRLERRLKHASPSKHGQETTPRPERFQLTEELIGESAKFLKANTVLEAIEYNGDIINVELPVKMEFKVVEAPPSIKGNTAQGGMKQVKLETGTTLNVPLFINQDDIVRINTETGQYVERVEKGK